MKKTRNTSKNTISTVRVTKLSRHDLFENQAKLSPINSSPSSDQIPDISESRTRDSAHSSQSSTNKWDNDNSLKHDDHTKHTDNDFNILSSMQKQPSQRMKVYIFIFFSFSNLFLLHRIFSVIYMEII